MPKTLGFILVWGIALTLLAFVPTAHAATIYVDVSASGAASGDSWTDAYTNLQTALAAAAAGDEIWVAAGTYKPGSNRTDTFLLTPNVAVYGGFTGGETNLDQRAPRLNETILSGDVNGDDGDTFTNYGENTYHVVKGAESAILDGVVIEGGYADDALDTGNEVGGGLYVPYLTTFIVRHVVFRRNYATNGAGVYIRAGYTVFEDCLFHENTATGSAGGLGADYGASVTIRRSAFVHNTAFDGSALRCGCRVPGSSLRLENCLVAKNTALQNGAINVWGSTGTILTNCTVAYNHANDQGGGIVVHGGGNVRAYNSIVWGNTAGVLDNNIHLNNGTFAPAYCALEGGYPGTSNIDADPLFLNSAAPAGRDGNYMTPDDGLRLSIESPCLDIAYTDLAPVDDILGKARPEGDGVDMGAYEARFIVYVDVDAPPGGDGTSWLAAFNKLEDAIADAVPGYRLWVAEGTYVHAGGRLEYFSLPCDISLYGGFAGTETHPDERDWKLHPTILSADANGDDLPGYTNYSDNKVHVIYGLAAENVVIDGFTIRGGYADYATGHEQNGAGLHLNGCRGIILKNLIISDNWAQAGAGIACHADTSVTIEDCWIERNHSQADSGGGLRLSQSSSCILQRSVIAKNTTAASAAALYTQDTALLLLENCLLYENQCTTANPQKGHFAIYSAASNGFRMVNCTAVTDTNNGFYCPSQGTVVNSVVYGATIGGTSSLKVSHSLVAGCYGSGENWNRILGVDLGGNVDANPMFRNPADPIGPDGVWFTDDDGFQFVAGTPCIDTGTPEGAPTSDISGAMRPLGSGIDMGIYETAAPSPPEVSVTLSETTKQPTWDWVSGGEGIGQYRYGLTLPDLYANINLTNALTYTPDSLLPAGTHILYVQERNSEGFWSGTGSAIVTIEPEAGGTIDTDPPTVEITSPEPNDTLSQALLHVKGTASDNLDVTRVTVEATGATNLPATDAEGTEDWSATITLAPGVSNIRVTAYDMAGNTGTASTTLTYVRPPNTPPIVTIQSPAEGSLVSEEVVTISGSVTDDGTVAAVRYWTDIAPTPSLATGTSNWSFQISLAEGEKRTVYVQAEDTEGLASQASIQIRRQLTPPLLTGGYYELVKVSHHGLGGEMYSVREAQDDILLAPNYNKISAGVSLGHFSDGEPLVLKLKPFYEESPETILSTDKERCRIRKIEDDHWRLAFEDWNDNDFNDIVVDIYKTQEPDTTVPATVSLHSAPATGQAPLRVQFTPTVTNPAGASLRYEWDFGDGTPPLITQSTGGVAHVYTLAGQHRATVSVIDEQGRSHSSTQAITITAPPGISLDIQKEPSSGYAPFSALFTATTEGMPPSFYCWDFDDDGRTDSIESSPTVLHVYSEPRTYTCTVAAVFPGGITKKASTLVHVSSGFNPPVILSSSVSTNQATTLEEIRFSVEASDDQGIAFYLWDFDADGEMDLKTETGEAIWRYEHAGRYLPSVVAVDGTGLHTPFHFVAIEINTSANPNATFITPWNGARVYGELLPIACKIVPPQTVSSARLLGRKVGTDAWSELGALTQSPLRPNLFLHLSALPSVQENDATWELRAAMQDKAGNISYGETIRLTITNHRPQIVCHTANRARITQKLNFLSPAHIVVPGLAMLELPLDSVTGTDSVGLEVLTASPNSYARATSAPPLTGVLFYANDATLARHARLSLSFADGSATPRVFHCANAGASWEEIYTINIDSVQNTVSFEAAAFGAYAVAETVPAATPDWPEEFDLTQDIEASGRLTFALSDADGTYSADGFHRAFLMIDGIRGTYDLYLALLAPDSNLYFMNNALQFSSANAITPVVTNWEAMPVPLTRFVEFPVQQLPAGTYAWYMVLTPPGASPLNPSNWVDYCVKEWQISSLRGKATLSADTQ